MIRNFPKERLVILVLQKKVLSPPKANKILFELIGTEINIKLLI